jgi:hypothetical protein
MKKMMKQVQKMQAELARAQQELAEVQIEGSSGGGAVKVILSGSGEALEVKIDPTAIDADDPSLLEDLVLAAFNEALKAQQELTQERLGGLTGGLPGMA